MSLLQKLKFVAQSLTKSHAEDGSLASLRFGENLSPNVRAIRLSMAVADSLIGAGVAVSDVVAMSLDITERYCSRRVMFDISSTTIMASQDRGNEREPLTMIRHSNSRTPNNLLVQSIQELVRDIDDGALTLDEAEERFDAILEKPPKYPFWLVALGGGVISLGVGVMFGASYIILAIMFLLGTLVSYILRLLGHKRVPAFFSQVLSSVFITLVAGGVAWLGNQSDLVWFHNLNPTLIVIGGIVMLVAGLAIVSAVQDAIDEYYMTANARLLRVSMMTAGIVAGVAIGLYLAKQLGIFIAVEADSQPLGRGDWQFTGAILISAGYALSQQSRLASVLLSGAIGALTWFIYTQSIGDMGVDSVVASGLAALTIGFVGTILARFWRTPSTALVMAGIVPLVPGLTLFNGLMQVIEEASSRSQFLDGMMTLFTALLIALAIASGASFGTFIARPLRRTIIRARNALPRRELYSDQQKS